jgi:hypothetical protein
MKLRDQLSRDLIRTEGRVHRWLDQYFPEFLTVFKDWKGKAALQSLRHFPLPGDVQRFSVEQIVEIWRQKVQRSGQSFFEGLAFLRFSEINHVY